MYDPYFFEDASDPNYSSYRDPEEQTREYYYHLAWYITNHHQQYAAWFNAADFHDAQSYWAAVATSFATDWGKKTCTSELNHNKPLSFYFSMLK